MDAINRIREIRRSKNITQKQMAQKLGLSQASYNKLENGNAELTIKKLEKICKAMDITPSSIINDENSGIGKENASPSQYYEQIIEYYQKIIETRDNIIKNYEERVKQLEGVVNEYKELYHEARNRK